ncbi:FKBP-type peptidyl-prolyl cis-trans isomerase [Nocardioides litoris]|uniref:FKBP-type peptidyl-prolyl cis-trans isomerase n=1 Tax=Nocardioides litoris TaxID=1926648 RepID=UPI001124019B|nr:FKBP-type peptidyl-prolyl cis-trans isomerase [Nocardioides litoris]
MLRGSRPTATIVASLVLSVALAGCGGSATPGTGLPSADRLDAVTVDGGIGAATIDFEERMTAGALEAETTIKGTGPALAQDEKAFVNYAIGNGYTQSTAIDSFGEEAAAVEVTVGAAENPEPASLDDVIANLLREYVKPGVTKGSRIVITGDSPAFFPGLDTTGLGALLAQDGIGNDDGLVMVVDVMDTTVLAGPDGGEGARPAWAPRVVFGGGGIARLDFRGLTKPAADDELVSAELRQGTGEAVQKGDLIVADYIGQVFDGAEPFDSSFGADREPISTPIGLGNVVAGWDEVLVGKKVGSRVIMRIPPAKGYAEQEQPGIPKNSTLYFVVDILAAV